MRIKTVQVVWHCKEPVFSIDFHPSGLLATGGGDKEVKVIARSNTVCVVLVARIYLLVQACSDNFLWAFRMVVQ